jgi:predicted XRE-type DNA-binding protein
MSKNFFGSVVDAVSDLNPVARNIKKIDKRIVEVLLDEGFSKKQIISYLDVYSSDVKKYINKLEKRIIKTVRVLQTGEPTLEDKTPTQSQE